MTDITTTRIFRPALRYAHVDITLPEYAVFGSCIE